MERSLQESLVRPVGALNPKSSIGGVPGLQKWTCLSISAMLAGATMGAVPADKGPWSLKGPLSETPEVYSPS